MNNNFGQMRAPRIKKNKKDGRKWTEKRLSARPKGCDVVRAHIRFIYRIFPSFSSEPLIMHCSLSLLFLQCKGSCPFHSGMPSSLRFDLPRQTHSFENVLPLFIYQVSTLLARLLPYDVSRRVWSSTTRRQGLRYPANPYGRCSVEVSVGWMHNLPAYFPQKKARETSEKELLARLIKEHARRHEKSEESFPTA